MTDTNATPREDEQVPPPSDESRQSSDTLKEDESKLTNELLSTFRDQEESTEKRKDPTPPDVQRERVNNSTIEKAQNRYLDLLEQDIEEAKEYIQKLPKWVAKEVLKEEVEKSPDIDALIERKVSAVERERQNKEVVSRIEEAVASIETKKEKEKFLLEAIELRKYAPSMPVKELISRARKLAGVKEESSVVIGSLPPRGSVSDDSLSILKSKSNSPEIAAKRMQARELKRQTQ